VGTRERTGKPDAGRAGRAGPKKRAAAVAHAESLTHPRGTRVRSALAVAVLQRRLAREILGIGPVAAGRSGASPTAAVPRCSWVSASSRWSEGVSWAARRSCSGCWKTAAPIRRSPASSGATTIGDAGFPERVDRVTQGRAFRFYPPRDPEAIALTHAFQELGIPNDIIDESVLPDLAAQIFAGEEL
jgi:hypothetical protein